MRPVVPCATPLKALCLCAGTVGACHWEWACPSSTGIPPRAPVNQTDPTIPLQYKPSVSLNDPTELMLQMQQLRQIQQQTERLRQQNEALRQENRPVLAAPLRSSSVDSAADGGPADTGGMGNGYWWRLLPDQPKWAFLLGIIDGLSMANEPTLLFPQRSTRLEIAQALDTFYGNADNRGIPVVGALLILKMKEAGMQQSAIDEEILAQRRIAQALAKH